MQTTQKRLNIFFSCILLVSLFAGLPVNAQETPTELQEQNMAAAARERAVQAEAPDLATGEWERAEKSLAKADKLAAKSGQSEKITQAYFEAAEDYNAAELEALSVQLLDPARRALRAARDERAHRYAPITYKGAETALAEAEAFLIENRYASEEIRALVEQARFEADYATHVARQVAAKPETETLIRDRDYYLYSIAKAAGSSYPLGSDPDTAVKALETTVANLYAQEQQLQKDLTDSQTFVAALEEEIRVLDQELGGASAERRQLVMQIEDQARIEEQFRQTEALFNEQEADVFRQSDTVVVRLFGLQFESGSAELEPANYPLMEKVSRALDIYSSADITIEGHTDSQGGSRLNQRLSQNRADAIADYMAAELGVAANRIQAIGYGPSRPIANNETKEGRARNRRIDLIIRPRN